MGYILRDEVLIKRPIIFLCGPYFKKGNKSDRRYLLRKCFRKHYRDGVLPLIIDDFLTEDNIKSNKTEQREKICCETKRRIFSIFVSLKWTKIRKKITWITAARDRKTEKRVEI